MTSQRAEAGRHRSLCGTCFGAHVFCGRHGGIRAESRREPRGGRKTCRTAIQAKRSLAVRQGFEPWVQL